VQNLNCKEVGRKVSKIYLLIFPWFILAALTSQLSFGTKKQGATREKSSTFML
jgi:hypothetical protein